MGRSSSYADAREAAIAIGTAAAVGVEEVALPDATGRVAAHDVPLPEALPRFDASAMDGFAVRAIDATAATASSPVTLEVVSEARAGHPRAAPIGRGEAARISTGARLPEGADAVIRVEDVAVADGTIRVRTAVEAGHDIRRVGEDVAAGDRGVSAGSVLHPGRIALLAGAGVATVRCRRRPTITVIVTGDELVSAGGAVDDGTIHDVNGVAVPSLLRAAGAGDVSVVAVGDDPAATVRALADIRTDLTVVCGGVSVGPHDHVRTALESLGATAHVAGVEVQPGKPTWLGTLPGADGPRPVLALPGNPGAALVMTVLLMVPLLRAMGGRPRVLPRRARLVATTRSHATRLRVLRVRLGETTDGGRTALVLDGQQPHRLASLAGTDALALVPPSSVPLAAGSTVEVVPLPGVADR